MGSDVERIPFVDLKAQYRSIRGEIDEAMARVVARAAFILGEEVEEFESAFATFCGADCAVGCGNGTDALALALRAVGVRPGDEVLTVAHSFIATAEAIAHTGALPVLVDVRPDSLLMDAERLEAAIGPRTKAIVPVHLYGRPADMDPILEVARRRRLRVVEDAAQAHGARYHGRPVGTLGDAAAFSFFPGKNLGAYGDAGAVVTNDPDVAKYVRMARDHGRLLKYEHAMEGWNSRMDAIQGAVLRVKLAHLPAWNAARQSLARAYLDELKGVAGVVPVSTVEDADAVWHLFVVRVENRDAVLAKVRASGVDAGIHYPIPIHLQPAFRRLGVGAGTLPVTEAAAGLVLSLPLYPELSRENVTRVVQVLAEAAGGRD